MSFDNIAFHVEAKAELAHLRRSWEAAISYKRLDRSKRLGEVVHGLRHALETAAELAAAGDSSTVKATWYDRHGIYFHEVTRVGGKHTFAAAVPDLSGVSGYRSSLRITFFIANGTATVVSFGEHEHAYDALRARVASVVADRTAPALV